MYRKANRKLQRARDFCKMNEIPAGVVIQCLHKKDLAPKAVHADMTTTVGKDAPSYAT